MKNIKYTEPKSYFPKSVRDQYFGKNAKKAAPAKGKKAAPTKKGK